MNGRRAFRKPLLAAACLFAFAATAAVAAAAPSMPSPGRSPAAGRTTGNAAGTVTAAVPGSPEYVPGDVLVKYKASVTAAGVRADALLSRATVREQITGPAVPHGRLALLHSSTLSTPQLIAEYSADPRVEYAEPDYVRHVLGAPNDPLYSDLWGMQQIFAADAWRVSTGSSNVVVADIDTGIDYIHPDLVANLWTNPGEIAGDGKDNDNNGYVDDVHGINLTINHRGQGDPWDDHGHGTHTAGIMAAVGNNGIGVAGVCWTARIMACKVFNSNGSDDAAMEIVAINYIISEKQQGVHVVAANCSFGGSPYSQSEHDAIAAAGNAGIVFVCAAGNSTNDNDAAPMYPASYDCSNIIAVAASDGHDILAPFSSYGATTVDLAAPGMSVYSTVPSFWDPSGYAMDTGTSMAAPHVTGAIALCAAAFPGDTVAQRMDRVLSTVDTNAALSGKVRTGGELDLAGAVGATNDIPGVAVPGTYIASTLDASSRPDAVYRMSLTAGAIVYARLSADAGTDFELYLFNSAVTTVADKGAALDAATGGSYPAMVTITVPVTGTYYLDVHAVSGSGGFSLARCDYDDDIPGTALPLSPVVGTIDSTQQADYVRHVTLAYGQTLTASLTGPDGSDVTPLLFGPQAFSVCSDGPLATGSSGAYPRTLSYTAWRSGTYFLDNHAAAGSGSYTLNWSVTGPGDNDISGAPPIPGTWYQGLISSTYDRDDVFAIPVFSRQTVNVSVTGDSGTEYDLYAFDPSATTVEGHMGALASAAGTSYPASLTFTAAASGSFFATDYYVDVYAVTGEGGYTITYSTLYDTTPPVTTATGLRTSATAGWRNTSQAVTLNAGDSGGSGVGQILYTVDGAQHTYSGSFNVSGSGSHTITYWSTDNAGNEETPHNVGYVNIDTTAPTSHGGPLQSSPTSGWRNTSEVVRLAASDASGGSGLAHIYYTVNNTEQQFTYADPFTISAQGSHLVTYWATDNAGNEETPHHVGYVNIDTTPPVTTDNAGSAWHAGPWTMTRTPADPPAGDGSHSGMLGGQATTQYSLDGGATWQTGTSVVFPRWKRGGGSGTYTVLYKSTDAAGNSEQSKSTTVRIDNSLPTSSAALTTAGNPATVTLTATDPDSGVACLWYSLDGGVWTQVTYPSPAGVPLAVSGLGLHTLRYYAVDSAGNSQAGYNVAAVTVSSSGSAINAKLAHRHRQPHVRRRR